MKYEELYGNYYDPVREEMIHFARMRGLVNYEVLAHTVGLPTERYMLQNLLPKLLGQISTDECAAKRPMLSAIVIRKDKKVPGDGFFKLAQDLGFLETGATRAESTEFWKQEKEDVFREWSDRASRHRLFKRVAAHLQRLVGVRPGAGV